MSSFCFFRNPKTWIPALAPVPVIAAYLGLGLVSVLTSTALVLTTIFFTSSKQKRRQDEKSKKHEGLRRDCLPHNREVKSKALAPEKESIPQQEENQGKEEESQIDENKFRSPQPTFLSESDCLGRSSSSTEDSEVDWLFQDKLLQSPDYSDGSISDEESLFEIALPSGQCLHHRQQEPKFTLPKKLPVPDFNLSGSCFRQHGLKELLAELNEMNEEENFIEIDIFMGSIKCPRFEIEA